MGGPAPGTTCMTKAALVGAVQREGGYSITPIPACLRVKERVRRDDQPYESKKFNHWPGSPARGPSGMHRTCRRGYRPADPICVLFCMRMGHGSFRCYHCRDTAQRAGGDMITGVVDCDARAGEKLRADQRGGQGARACEQHARLGEVGAKPAARRLHVACCMSSVACCTLHVVRCTLHVVRCMLHVLRALR